MKSEEKEARDAEQVSAVLEYEQLIEAVAEEAGKKYDLGKSPIVQGCLHYFPTALKAVAEVSAYGADKYCVPFSDKNWARVADGANRYMDADGRHLLGEAEEGMYDRESGLLHAAHHAWDALARLQLLLASGTPLVDPVRGRGPHRC